MNYAVILSGGKQYKVEKGKELVVDLINIKKNDVNVVFDKVLLIVDDGKVVVGKPFVDGAIVRSEIIDGDYKGEKVRVSKFLGKSRYRKVMGYRPRLTKVLIKDIEKKSKAA